MTNKPKRSAAYAAVYIDRGDKLDRGRNAVKTQLGLVRQAAEREGYTIPVVAIDVIVGKRDVGKLENLVTEAERLAHEAFADYDGNPTFYVVGLFAETSAKDPRKDNPNAAMWIAVQGMSDDLADRPDWTPTEHGYELRTTQPDES